MLNTRMKARNERQVGYKKDLSNIHFLRMEWAEVRFELSEVKKTVTPSKRWGHTFTVLHGRVFMIGGSVKGSTKVPLCLYEVIFEKGTKSGELASWKKHTLTGADEIYSIDSHSCEVYDGKIYIFFGNLNGSINNKVFKVDVDKMAITEVKFPHAFFKNREAHVSFMALEKYAVVFGGISGEDSNGNTMKMGEKNLLMVLNMETERKLDAVEIEQNGKAPCERESHLKLVHKNGVFIFGGLTTISTGQSGMMMEFDNTKEREEDLKEKQNRKVRMNNRRKEMDEIQEARLAEGRKGAIVMEEGTKQGVESRGEGMEFFLYKAESGQADKEGSAGEQPDFLNDLYFVRWRTEGSKLVLEWERVNYNGQIPQASSLAGFTLNSEFLFFFGGQGYNPAKVYQEEDRTGDFLNSVYCLSLETKNAFLLNVTGLAVDPLEAPAYFTINNRFYLHGGWSQNKYFSSKMYQLEIEQRVKEDLFGEFVGNLKQMCLPCKIDYDHCVHNLEAALRNQKKNFQKRLDGDKNQAKIEPEQARFEFSPGVIEDMRELIEMEIFQMNMRDIGRTHLINQLTFFFYQFKQSLFVNAINFEYLGPHDLGMYFDGSFNIFHLIESAEKSILNSIFFYIIQSAIVLKADVYLYVAVKSRILQFGFRGSSLKADHLQPEPPGPPADFEMRQIDYNTPNLPECLKAPRFKRALLAFSNCQEGFARVEEPCKDIRVQHTERQNAAFKLSFRLYWSIFFREKPEALRLAVQNAPVPALGLSDLLKAVDQGVAYKVMLENPRLQGINCVLRLDLCEKHPVLKELKNCKTQLVYNNQDCLIDVVQLPIEPQDREKDVEPRLLVLVHK
jgi:hypothetical protein